MRILRSILFAVTVLAAWPAWADDLPLKHGIYVKSTVGCKGASEASMAAFFGGRKGISFDHFTTCEIKSVRKSAGTNASNDSYNITERCSTVDPRGQGEGPLHADVETVRTVVVVAHDGLSFALNDKDHDAADPDDGYEWCAPSTAFLFKK